jgi:hypothetical protein
VPTDVQGTHYLDRLPLRQYLILLISTSLIVRLLRSMITPPKSSQDENTPRPLAFIAYVRRKKHLYCPPRVPLVDCIRKAIAQFANKFAREAYFEIARIAPSEAPKIAKIPSLKMFNATLQTS